MTRAHPRPAPRASDTPRSGRSGAGAARAAASASAPQKVRIIGGLWRRTPLPVIAAAGLRPTPDRVRETLFNWLGQDLSGLDCLDLFAGTGALGLEAASRGARTVWMAETDPRAQASLQAVIERLGAGDRVSLHRGDARGLIGRLAAQGRRADVVFLDPPFHQQALEAVMPLLAPVLAPEAWVYVETEAGLTDDQVKQWCGPFAAVLRRASAGQVHYHLLRCQSAPEGTQEKP